MYIYVVELRSTVRPAIRFCTQFLARWDYLLTNSYCQHVVGREHFVCSSLSKAFVRSVHTYILTQCEQEKVRSRVHEICLFWPPNVLCRCWSARMFFC